MGATKELYIQEMQKQQGELKTMQIKKISYSEGITTPTATKFETIKILISADADLTTEDNATEAMSKLKSYVKEELQKAMKK